MLKGIAHFERTHHIWTAFHDDQAISETDLRWIRGKRWQGVISRHTTPQLVAACAERKLPLQIFPWAPAYARAGLAENAVYLLRPDTYVGLADETGSAEALQSYLRNGPMAN